MVVPGCGGSELGWEVVAKVGSLVGLGGNGVELESFELTDPVDMVTANATPPTQNTAIDTTRKRQVEKHSDFVVRLEECSMACSGAAKICSDSSMLSVFTCVRDLFALAAARVGVTT